jgi:hypothetical protein
LFLYLQANKWHPGQQVIAMYSFETKGSVKEDNPDLPFRKNDRLTIIKSTTVSLMQLAPFIII